jgi:3-oxoacyl-[acyl-carrier-protein] synthase II
VKPVPVIAGIGLVTVLGDTAHATWDALLADRYITDHSRVPLVFPGDLSRVSHLAIRAAREALDGRSSTQVDSNAALIVGTSKGSVENWLAPPSALSDVESPVCFGIAEVCRDVAMALKLTGPRLTISSACASGLHALIRGAMMIESGEARKVLVVAAEASVHPLFIGSFRRLGVVPANGIGCRPFDISRDGFLMSEAAAAVCLEVANPDDDRIQIESFALGADATHLTGSDPAGHALRHLLARVIADRPPDVIHAHGTGTRSNDAIELAAIDSALAPSKSPVDVYSHKGALGHSLGAAGLVSVVLNCLMHRTGTVPPNVRTNSPLPAARARIQRRQQSRTIRRSIAIAAGFGGPLAVVGLRQP